MDRSCPKRRRTDDVMLNDQDVYLYFKKSFFENLEKLNDKRFVPKCTAPPEWPTAFIVNLHHDSYSICLESIVSDLETDSFGYEENDLLWYIDNETVPPVLIPLMDQMAKVSHNKIIAELRDFRGINKTLKCPIKTKHLLTKPTESSVLEMYDALGDQMSLTHLQQLENYLIIMTEEPLCLDPSTDVFFLESLIDFNKRKKYAMSLQSLVKKEKYTPHGNHDNSCIPDSTKQLTDILTLSNTKTFIPKECDTPVMFTAHNAPDMSIRISELATKRFQSGQDKQKADPKDDKSIVRIMREGEDHLISPHQATADNVSPGYMVTPPAPPQLKPAPFIAINSSQQIPPTMHPKPTIESPVIQNPPNRMGMMTDHNKPKLYNQSIAYVMQHPMNKITPPNMQPQVMANMMAMGPAGQKAGVTPPAVQNMAIRPNQPQMMQKPEQMPKPLANPGVLIGQQGPYPRQYQYQEMGHMSRGYPEQPPYMSQRGQMIMNQPLALPPNMNPHMTPAPPHLAPVQHPPHPAQHNPQPPMVPQKGQMAPIMRQQPGIALPANLTAPQMSRAGQLNQQMQMNQIQNPNIYNPNHPNQFG